MTPLFFSLDVPAIDAGSRPASATPLGHSPGLGSGSGSGFGSGYGSGYGSGCGPGSGPGAGTVPALTLSVGLEPGSQPLSPATSPALRAFDVPSLGDGALEAAWRNHATRSPRAATAATTMGFPPATEFHLSPLLDPGPGAVPAVVGSGGPSASPAMDGLGLVHHSAPPSPLAPALMLSGVDPSAAAAAAAAGAAAAAAAAGHPMYMLSGPPQAPPSPIYAPARPG
ncbi:hypothetical protein CAUPRSCDRAFT_12945, partial [Caulochytrium protostelioides]